MSRCINLGLEWLEPRWALAAGDLDLTFSGDGLVVQDLGLGLDEEINATIVQSDGKILVAGITNTPGGADRDFMVARFNTNGTLDTSFGTGGFTIINMSGITPPANNVDDVINDIAIDSLGRIVVVGSALFPASAGNTGFGIARLTSSGQLDTTFSGDGKLITIFQDSSSANINAAANTVALQTDGKIVVGGTANTPAAATHRDFIVARYNDDGTLDTTFDVDGYVITDFDGASGPTADDNLLDIAIQSDGRIVAVGNAQSNDLRPLGSQEVAIARYNSNGSLDTMFGGGDGKVLTDIAPAAFSSQDTANAVAIEADGQIIVAGFASVRNSSSSTTTNLDYILGRYNSDGTLDATFAPSSAVPGTLRIDFSTLNDEGRGLILQPQPDGKYVVGGRIAVTAATAQFGLARVLTNGSLDTSFSGDGKVQTSFPASGGLQGNDIALQPDGKIIAAGWVQTVGGNRDIAIARYESGLVLQSISGLADVNEGATYTLGLSSSDPTTSQWSINWGDSVQIVSGNPASVTHVYADGDNNYTISATVTTDDGNFAVGNTVAVMVHNVAPTLAISGPADVNEGSGYTLNLSSFDPGTDTITSWTINWGDGIEFVSGNPASVMHTYADGDANFVISATATDEDGTFTAGNTVAVMVHNVAPTANDATFTLLENSPNGTVVGNVTANDPGADTLTFTIIGGSGAAAFAIDSSGQITVADSSLLDFETSPTLTLDVEVADGDGGFDTATITINLLNQASISGVVFVDVNQNGLFDANEPGIDGVVVKLLDQFGNPVLDDLGDAITAITNNGGFYLFEDLDPGIYQLLEMQPTGVNDGAEDLGSLGGTIVANDRMQLTLAQTDAFDYAFAELGQQLSSGDTATIGFWQNKHGQALITQGGTQLAAWLTTNFSNIFGNALAGASGSDVANFYRDQLFKQLGQKSAGPAKVDAQFMAVALATYFTSSILAGQAAVAYGFNVTDTGIGTNIVNVGTNGTAFGVANGTDLTILQLLQATDSLTDQPDSQLGFAAIYDTNGDGVISATEAALRSMANDVFSSINEAGDI